MSGEIAASAYASEGRSATELVDDAERRVFEIAEQGKRTGSGFVPLRDVLGATIDRLDMLHQSQGQLTGVSSGYTDLDKMTAGLQPGDLVIVAGRPSMARRRSRSNPNTRAIANQTTGACSAWKCRANSAFRMISSIVSRRPEPSAHRHVRDEDWAASTARLAQMRTRRLHR